MPDLPARLSTAACVLSCAAFIGCGDNSSKADTSSAGTGNSAGTSNAGTSDAGTGNVATNSAGTTSSAGMSNASTSSAGTASNAGAGGKSALEGTGGSSSANAGSGNAGSSSGAAGGSNSETKFSFFVTSLRALLAKAGPDRPEGFGGDFSNGETGPGAGLRGADKLCAAIAEDALKGAGSKPWRAFLSATKDENGKQVDAIDRIGPGPWYDRLGRLVAASKADLLADRPKGADDAIRNDLPNEDGVPNHKPDPTQEAADNHHTLTGSNAQGKLQSATATCLDWTSNKGESSEGKPRAGLAWPRAMTSGSTTNWISAVDAPGCAPGVRVVEGGGPKPNDNTVGNGGGYGAFYCFSMVP